MLRVLSRVIVQDVILLNGENFSLKRRVSPLCQGEFAISTALKEKRKTTLTTYKF